MSARLVTVDPGAVEELAEVRRLAEELVPAVAALCERARPALAALDHPPYSTDDVIEQLAEAERFWVATGVTAARDALSALAACLDSLL